MCGIYCCVEAGPSTSPPALTPKSLCRLLRRGPDLHSSGSVPLSPALRLHFHSAVLAMRGAVTAQPLGDRLLFNGSVWQGLGLEEGANDGAALLRALQACRANEDMVRLIAGLRGPFAFVYAAEGALWFARDLLGRRSLLWAADAQGRLHLSSVAVETEDGLVTRRDWEELPSGVLFKLHEEGGALALRYQPMRCNVELDLVEELGARLPLSLLDCEGFVPSRLLVPSGALPSAEDLAPFDAAISPQGSREELMGSLEELLRVDCEALEGVLREAVRRRLERSPLEPRGAPVGVLFSGGVDSLFLAALASQVASPDVKLRLYNVAFAKDPQGSYQVPDRVLGRAAAAKLAELFPGRQWDFVEVNVSAAELSAAREERIRALVAPLGSVLDDSLGCALWFAARGPGGEAAESRPRILIGGSGADELLGGYSRHRARFQREGWSGLAEELRMELGRISRRNLGRDDRIVADHGREARLPFLDEEVVSLLGSLPLHRRLNLALPRGVGEKVLLRLCLWRLGLGELSLSPKRALQFGSRIAKLEQSKEKASDACARLLD